MTTTDQYRRFRELHQSGCFLIPNPWDQGSAIRRLTVMIDGAPGGQ
jgi:2-methylisocitrate lyase-like PEP mutase family enzyme